MSSKRFFTGENIYGIGILLLGLGISSYCLWQYPVRWNDLASFFLFLNFLILTTLSMRFGLNLRPNLTLHVDTTLLIAGVFTFNPAMIILIAGLASIASFEERRNFLSSENFLKIGQRLVYVGVSALFLDSLGLSPWKPGGLNSWAGLFATLLLIGIIWGFISAGQLSIRNRANVFVTWWHQIKSNIWSDVALFGVGVVVILLVTYNPWSLVLITIPSIIIYLTLNQLTKVQTKLEKEVNERERAETTLRDSIIEEKRAQNIQKAIYQISQAANATQNLKELFPAIHSILGGLLPAENFYIALYDPITEELSFPYFVDQYDPPPPSRKFGKGLTEYLMHSGTPVFANPEVFDDLVQRGKVDSVGTPSVDWLGVPLKVEQRIIGGMVVQIYEPGIRYGKEELDILEFVSSQVAMAIERKRSEQALRESERFLASIFSSIQDGISILDTDLNIISVNAIMERWYAHSMPLVGKKCYMAYHGRTERCKICPSQRTLATRTAEHDVIPKIGSHGETVGWLDIFSFPFLDATTGQLKGVIEYVRDITPQKQAENALLHRAEELAVLHAVAILGVEADDEDSLIERATEIIGATLYPNWFGILLMDESGKHLYTHPSFRGLVEEGKKILVPLGKGITGQVALTGKSWRIPDVTKEPTYINVTQEVVGSELCVPLKVGETVIGLINIESTRLDAFSEADERLVTIMAGQLATAIQRLRTQKIERQQAKQLAIIYEISQEIVGASLDPEQVYKAIHQAVSKLMPGEAFVIALLDSTANQIDIVYQVDRSGRAAPTRLPTHRGLSGYVIETGKSLLINDLDQTDDIYDVVYLGDPEKVRSVLMVPMQLGGKIIGALSIQSYFTNAYTPSDLHLLELLTANAAIALGNARLHEETLRHMDELSVLVRVSSALRIAQTRDDMLPIILEQLCQLLKINSAAIVLMEENTGRPRVSLATGGWMKLKGLVFTRGLDFISQVINTGQPAFNADIHQDAQQHEYSHLINEDYNTNAIPLFAQGKTLGALWVGRTTNFTHEEMRLLTAVADIAANAFYRSSLHEQTRKHAEQMAQVSAIGRQLTQTLDIPGIYHRLSTAIFEILTDIRAVIISRFSPQWETITCVYGLYHKQPIDVSEIPVLSYDPSGTDYQSETIRTQSVLIVNDSGDAPQNSAWQVIMGEAYPQAALFVPLLAKGEVLGVIQIQSNTIHRFSKDDADLLTLLGNTGAIALENARLFLETEKRLRRLAALRAMDLAISSSFDLNVTLNVLLDQVIIQLGMDAADVLLFDEYTKTLEYAAGRGFRSNAITRSKIKLNEDLAGHAAIERQLISNKDYPQYHLNTPRLAGEDFVSSFDIPLITKGQIKGVLEVFHRSPFIPDTEWLDFLETLAHDTAIAIDNASLFSDLQRTNLELTLAYDITLESWSRIFEMHAHEPEGHIQQEAELSMELARAIGVEENELVNIRRGVLLHDIGMLAVPDYIIQKPDSLTQPEWEVVKSHPVFAHELLSTIPYLHPAMDIAYCHHEKWDGSGYPRGLMGEQIPLSARLCAVVDVWNAMLSPRPYHQALAKTDVIEYLRSQAGKHFDPLLVDTFLTIITAR